MHVTDSLLKVKSFQNYNTPEINGLPFHPLPPLVLVGGSMSLLVPLRINFYLLKAGHGLLDLWHFDWLNGARYKLVS